MSAMDRLRAAAKDVADRGRTELAAARAADPGRLGRVEALGRDTMARVGALGGTGATRRDELLERVGGSAVGAALGDGARRFGRLMQRVPLVTVPMDLLQERHGIDALISRVRTEPGDVMVQIWLGEAMQADLRRYELARAVVSPQGAVFREVMKSAGALGAGPVGPPGPRVLSGAERLAAWRLRQTPKDGVALHAIARVRLATGRAEEAVTPAKLAVAAAPDAGERARALVTLARVYFELGADESAENVARKAVDGGCSLGWGLLADLLYRARPGDQAGSARHRTYVELRARVRDEDRRDYHGIHRDAAGVGRSVLDAQWARARALRPGTPAARRIIRLHDRACGWRPAWRSGCSGCRR